MGSSISKIKYEEILNITTNININIKSKKTYKHTIEFLDHSIIDIELSEKEEELFQMKYKWNQLFNKLGRISYYNIEAIKMYKRREEEPKYHFMIIYNNGNVETVDYISEQYKLFMELYKKYNEKNKIIMVKETNDSTI
jgi:hypothetical protein